MVDDAFVFLRRRLVMMAMLPNRLSLDYRGTNKLLSKSGGTFNMCTLLPVGAEMVGTE